MTTQISLECSIELMKLCEERYRTLTNGGCDEDVAADRVFDALNCVLDKTDTHCFDPRDRLFENRLRTATEKGRKSCAN